MREKIAEILESLVKMELTYKQANDAILALIAEEQAPLVRTLQVTSHALKMAGFSDGNGSVRELIDSTIKNQS